MSLKKRLTAVGIVAFAAGLTFVIAKSGAQVTEKKETPIFTNGRETVYIWYTDEALTSYISGAAVTYNENHSVRVVPVLESGLEYLEKINKTSIESNAPDMYVISHDSLEKAYLAGLAEEVEPPGRVLMNETYIGTGLQATTYKDKIIGYPFYFETSALLYNKTYLEDMAKSQLEAEADAAAALEAQEQLEENGPEEVQEINDGETQNAADTSGGRDEGMPDLTEESGENQAEEEAALTEEQQKKTEEKMQQLLPSTIEEIKTFADSYDAPEQVEAVFKWDVTDIFYNYFFIGNVIDMGGEAGWDISKIDIYNKEAIESMTAYEELNQFFSIDTNEINYESVLDDFMAGKLVFTVATTDAVSRLEQAKEDGLFEYDYGITLSPDINDEMETRSLSVTNCVVINGYSAHQEAANDFALFLTSEYSDILYARAGKASAASDADCGYESLDQFRQEYGESISMPKMIETSNFWVQLEVAFAQIWDGADPNQKLKELSEQIMQQVTGRPYEEEYIEYEKKKEDVEYLDEEYYKQEAMEE